MGYPPRAMIGPALIARWALAAYTRHVSVEGLENVPATGAVMLVARHFHHLLDGAVLVRYVPRPLHIIAGLDWTANVRQRVWMERACRAVAWPIVLRSQTLGERGGYERSELLRYTRRARNDVAALLRAGRAVVAFPEGYPNVDPAFARKTDDAAFLPFNDGYARMIAAAGVPVAVVPVGFAYARGPKWTIVARFGTARYDLDLKAIEAAVQRLSLEKEWPAR